MSRCLATIATIVLVVMYILGDLLERMATADFGSSRSEPKLSYLVRMPYV